MKSKLLVVLIVSLFAIFILAGRPKAKADNSSDQKLAVDPIHHTTEPSIGRAPLARKGNGGSGNESATLNPGSTAYAIDVYPGENEVTFDSATPGSWTIIGSVAGTAYFAGDFLNGDFTKIYALDYNTNALYTINTTTAAQTFIGPSIPNSGESWAGMTASSSGTLYASGTTCGSSSLYTINPATGAVTFIGNITNGSCIIDIAINTAGQMYGLDIVSDNLLSINTATGAGTVIGYVGFDANYAQGMDFDDATGTLYLAAFNLGTWSGELRTADTSTGMSTLIGAFPGGAEVDCLAFATTGGVNLLYDSSLITDVCNGTGSGGGNGILDPGEDVTIDVTLRNTSGLTGATGVSAVLSTTTAGITITDNLASFPDIGPAGTGACLAPHYTISVGTGVACGTVANFDLAITSNEGTWNASFSYTVGTVTPGAVTTLINEGFETWPLTGWTITGGCPNGWESGINNCNYGNTTGGSGDYADANTDCECDPMDTTMTTPLFDLSGSFVSAQLQFKSDFQDYVNSDYGYVDISTNGGGTWTNILTYALQDYPGPRTETIDLTPYLGNANCLIRFRYVAPGWDWYWQVDDVVITKTAVGTCTSNPCTPATGAYDLWFKDDLGRSTLCINSTTGAYDWSILRGPYAGVYYGTVTVRKVGGMYYFYPKTGGVVIGKYNSLNHTAYASYSDRITRTYSGLTDRNTTNNGPPVCP